MYISGNIALNKSAIQSSTWNGHSAQKSLDEDGCSITLLDREPWLMVDLIVPHVITDVILRNVQYGGR